MLTPGDWASIYAAISKGNREKAFIQSEVIDRNEERNIIFVRELGSEEIPIVGLDHVVYAYKNGEREKVIVEPMLPEIGDIVLIANLGIGSHSHRCVGIVQRNRPWRQPQETEISA